MNNEAEGGGELLRVYPVRAIQEQLTKEGSCGLIARFSQYFGVNGGGNSLHLRLAGGEAGIRTLGTGVSPYNGLANRRIRPLCHLSGVPS